MGASPPLAVGAAMNDAPVGGNHSSRKSESAMPTPIISGAIKVTVTGEYYAQLVENVWGVYAGAGTPDAADLATICGIFQANYAAILNPLVGAMTVSSFTARYLGDALGPEATLVNSPVQSGGQVGAGEPGNVALCISLRSGFAGRRFRGRKYFSGIPVSQQVNNFLEDTFVNDMVSAVQELITDLAANSTPLAVISVVGLTVTPVVTAVAVDTAIDSMRRRLAGRGR